MPQAADTMPYGLCSVVHAIPHASSLFRRGHPSPMPAAFYNRPDANRPRTDAGVHVPVSRCPHATEEWPRVRKST